MGGFVTRQGGQVHVSKQAVCGAVNYLIFLVTIY